LEKLGRVTARAATALAEAETMFERCRSLSADGTLFALQDVLLLAAEATTPLHRAETNLADAAQYSRAGEEHIPRMEGQLGVLAAEADKNRAARRNWGVWDLASRIAGQLPGFAIAGALAGILVRVGIYFAAGQFHTLRFAGMLSTSLVYVGLGAVAGAVAAAFRAIRWFKPAK
jgi:hypothetical protein